jgi:monofunctional biosynthetic peptidoglycan transglycosylase
MNGSTKQYLITDFSNLAGQQWQIVNDGVMGGLSRSHLQINEDGNAVFLGHVSLQNNGGFASVKNSEPLSIEGAEFIRLHVKGDGKRYSFRLRTKTEGERNHWVYEIRFSTSENKWEMIDLPLSDLKAVFRGRPQPDAPPADLSGIVEYGFLISDRQKGDFRLEIDSIHAIAKS